MVPRTLFQCFYAFVGPRLYRHPDVNGYGQVYVANGLEKTGDFFIKWMVTMYNIAYGISPFLVWTLWRRNMLNQEGFLTLFKYGVSASILFTGSSTIRAFGRLFNRDYVRFLTLLHRARQGQVVDWRRYDYDFWAMPVNFYWSEGPRGDPAKDIPLKYVPSVQSETAANNNNNDSSTIISKIVNFPWNCLCYGVAHTFGYRLLYPGSLGFLQAALGAQLQQGRTKLLEEQGGRRGKVRTRDGNDIDTVFVDRRNRHSDGQYLVVCSEGNAAFYEVGCMTTPIESEYSVMGWNHPGFGGSTGKPFPDQEQEAIDAVMQYATFRLGFPQEKIILFAWSIGGYTASFAALNYPRVKAVILDATFDHVLPLALKQMPSVMSSVIFDTVTKHANLNNGEMLQRYQGPFVLIRRTKDEMITTVGPPNPIEIWSNRGNNLLIMLLTTRYPMIFSPDAQEVVLQYLALESEEERDSFLSDSGVDEQLCGAKLHSFVDSIKDPRMPTFPLTLEPASSQEANQLALFLTTKHMRNFRSSHCSPLPLRFFDLPFDVDKR